MNAYGPYVRREGIMRDCSRRFALVAFVASTVLASCSSGGESSSPPSAPSNLTYATNPAVYTTGVAITNNTPSSTGGVVVSYSVSPSLPAGLSLSTSTGVISGTPAAITAQATYTVTAANSGGSTTASLVITIAAPPQWRVVPYPSGFPTHATAVWGSGPNDVWIGAHDPNPSATQTTAFAHWDGQNWTTVTTASPFYPNAISGSGPGNAWAAGEGGRITHWNGSNWSPPSVLPTPYAWSLNAVWVGSDTDAWVFGLGLWFGHWNGFAWQSVERPVADSTLGGGASFAGYVWAVGAVGTTVYCSSASASCGGGGGAPWNGNYYDIWGTGLYDYWVVGYGTSGGTCAGALRHNNGGWDRVFSGPAYCLTDLWGSGSNDVWAVGLNGTMWHWDGSSLVPYSGITSSTLNDIWGFGANDIWAVGEGVVLRYSP
jgi:hypothetical protein